MMGRPGLGKIPGMAARCGAHAFSKRSSYWFALRKCDKANELGQLSLSL